MKRVLFLSIALLAVTAKLALANPCPRPTRDYPGNQFEQMQAYCRDVNGTIEERARSDGQTELVCNCNTPSASSTNRRYPASVIIPVLTLSGGAAGAMYGSAVETAKSDEQKSQDRAAKRPPATFTYGVIGAGLGLGTGVLFTAVAKSRAMPTHQPWWGGARVLYGRDPRRRRFLGLGW